MNKHAAAKALGSLGGKAADGKGLKKYWDSMSPRQKAIEEARRRNKGSKHK